MAKTLYRVLKSTDLDDLADQVKGMLKGGDGWTLQGGIATVVLPDGSVQYLQAVAW